MSCQQAEAEQRRQDSGSTDGVVTHQRSEARQSLSISQDGGVQSRSVALGLDVRQTVGVPRHWTDAAVAGFLQGASRA